MTTRNILSFYTYLAPATHFCNFSPAGTHLFRLEHRHKRRVLVDGNKGHLWHTSLSMTRVAVTLLQALPSFPPKQLCQSQAYKCPLITLSIKDVSAWKLPILFFSSLHLMITAGNSIPCHEIIEDLDITGVGGWQQILLGTCNFSRE